MRFVRNYLNQGGRAGRPSKGRIPFSTITVPGQHFILISFRVNEGVIL
jgi:hypothetical protein